MSAMLELPIELSTPGTPSGLSQFGSLPSSGTDGSSDQSPFATVLSSMSSGGSADSATPLTSSAGSATGGGGTSSDSSESSSLLSQLSLFGSYGIGQGLAKVLHDGSSKRVDGSGSSDNATSSKVSLYANLILSLLNLYKEVGNAGSTASGTGKQTAKAKSSSELFAKIGKKLSSLLGVGLATTTTESMAGSVSGSEAGPKTDQGISDLVQKLLSDPGIKSDLTKLVDASESGSSQAGYTAVLEDLLSRMNELGSQSAAKDAGKSTGQKAQTANGKTLETVSAAGSKVAGDAASSSTVGDLKKLVDGGTDNSTGGNSVTAAVNGGTKSRNSIGELLRNLGDGSGQEAFRKSNGVVHDKNVKNAASQSVKASVQKGTTEEAQAQSALSSTAGKTNGADSTSNGPTTIGQNNIQDAVKTASVAGQKATSTDASSLSGKESTSATYAALNAKLSQITNAPILGKQDSTKSDGSQSGTMSGTFADAFGNSTGVTGTTSTFKQSLSAASQNSSGVADAQATPYQVSQTILRGVNMMNEGGNTVVTLKLQPESLGTVSLQVASDSGKISAQFNVGTQDARAALEASIPQMRQMLQSNGISLTHLSVNLNSGESHSSHPQYQPRRHSARFYGVNNSKTEEALRSFGYNTMEVKV